MKLRYSLWMKNQRISSPLISFALVAIASTTWAQATNPTSTWTFAVSGDSRDCGDFVVPAIASKVKAEQDAFYWHLGDFRNIKDIDQDLASMWPSSKPPLTLDSYQKIAWDDFLEHQTASFGTLPVYLGRGNHEAIPPKTRQEYIDKFTSFLNRPDIVAQRAIDEAAEIKVDANYDGRAQFGTQPWYHFIRNGVDFITLDNADYDEFTVGQLRWLRVVLNLDLAPNSGVTSIVVGMHEALPNSTAADHGMNDWAVGSHTGETVYTWLYDANAAGKHVYILASHSHFYSPNIFYTYHWYEYYSITMLPGWIIGSAGAHRYALPQGAYKGSKAFIYAFLQGNVHADGTIDFALHELSLQDLLNSKWPNAPDSAITTCFNQNGNPQERADPEIINATH